MNPSQPTRARPSRRSLLVGLVGGTLALLSRPVARGGPAPDEPAWIDAHAHIWTRQIDRFPLARGTTLNDLAPPSFTAEELLETARAHHVGRVVLIAHHKFYGFDNRYLIDAVRRYPDAFRVVGLIDDSQPDPATEMRRLLKLGVTGFRIVPSIRGANWLNNPGMQQMWRCAADTGQAICCLINPRNVAEVDGFCERFPDTRVVVDHLARIGADGPITDGAVNELCRLARHRNTYVKVSAFYALGGKRPPYGDLRPMIRRVYEAFGGPRLMWGSDAPYQLADGQTYADSLALIREIDFISGDDRINLLRNTASKVFFFDAE